MKFKTITFFLGLLCVGISLSSFVVLLIRTKTSEPIVSSGAPPYGIAQEEVPKDLGDRAWINNWTRPPGPVKVALQIGHLDNHLLPEELAKLRNNGGSSGGGRSEEEVNQQIVELIRDILVEENIVVEILPATVPPRYFADVFISVHADGSEDWRSSGYKFAGPWRDFSGQADSLAQLLNETYDDSTGLVFDPNISRNMKGYYAFAWWRYEHSIHPMTTAVIAETGFLTSPNDRRIIIDQPELSARAIATAIIQHLQERALI